MNLNSSQSEQAILNRKELEEAERLNQSLRLNIAALTKEIEIHKEKTALAEQETDEMGEFCNLNMKPGLQP